MARTIDTIQNLMLADIAADDTLSALNSTSKRAIYRLITRVIATAIYLLESILDQFKTDVETIAASAAPASAAWLQNKVIQFQYDEDEPQVVQLINFVPQYPTVDTTMQIISRCSVNTTVANQVVIKVATGSPPAALSAPQLSALQDYVNTCGATIAYVVQSFNPDQIYINADIWYQGQYSAIIQENVEAAINSFLAALPFDGSLKVSDLERAIFAVTGVTDVFLHNVAARADGTPIGSATYLVLSDKMNGRLWPTVAGYCIAETTTGYTLDSSLIFNAQ